MRKTPKRPSVAPVGSLVVFFLLLLSLSLLIIVFVRKACGGRRSHSCTTVARRQWASWAALTQCNNCLRKERKKVGQSLHFWLAMEVSRTIRACVGRRGYQQPTEPELLTYISIELCLSGCVPVILCKRCLLRTVLLVKLRLQNFLAVNTDCTGYCLHCGGKNNFDYQWRREYNFSFPVIPRLTSLVLMSCCFAIVINGTACLIIHAEVVFTAIVAWDPYSPGFLFFVCFKKCCLHAGWRLGKNMGLVMCLCALVVHKLHISRQEWRDFSPCLLTQQSTAER